MNSNRLFNISVSIFFGKKGLQKVCNLYVVQEKKEPISTTQTVPLWDILTCSESIHYYDVIELDTFNECSLWESCLWPSLQCKMTIYGRCFFVVLIFITKSGFNTSHEHYQNTTILQLFMNAKIITEKNKNHFLF